MMGIVFKELRGYLTTQMGAAAWPDLLRQAGLGGRTFLTTEQYPDGELVALLGAASTAMGKPLPIVLEEFGEATVPGLLSIYKAFVKPEWDLFDLLEHTEDTIHRAVRLSDDRAQPPALRVERLGPAEVAISYSSPRKLCPFARGILQGAANQFGTTVQITEPQCMLRGDLVCRIEVAAV